MDENGPDTARGVIAPRAVSGLLAQTVPVPAPGLDGERGDAAATLN